MNEMAPATKRVLELLAKGLSATVIGERMGMSTKRVLSIGSLYRQRPPTAEAVE